VNISDTGVGIDSGLFTKFATKSTSGTGLGLFISKSIVEAHGGRIWGKNNYPEGKGATFGFSLALHQRFDNIIGVIVVVGFRLESLYHFLSFFRFRLSRNRHLENEELLVGFGKTRLKTIEEEYQDLSYFALASGSTGAGMIDHCFENRLRVFTS
jgi:hypothetical protein